MLVQEKLLKPILEARYLTVENADRYRAIIRFFYLQYEKMKYRFYLEDVLEELKEDPYFRDYTPEQVSAGSECSGRLEEPSGCAGYEEGCYDRRVSEQEIPLHSFGHNRRD